MGVTVLIILNLYTFIVAYPETYTLTPGISSSGSILAKDFSAFYVGAWRLWNNPANIYVRGALGGMEPATPPQPEAFKYLPSFLFVMSPFLALTYQPALFTFNVIQFALLPLIALLLYRLLEKKGLIVTFVVAIIALLQPFPTSQWGLSLSYYWQWAEGQAKVFSTFVLLLSLYLGSRGRPYLSGIALAIGFFDPRFGLLTLPLFLMYNWKTLRAALGSFVGALVFSNFMLLYPGTGIGFLNMVLNSGLNTPFYYYSFIPFLTVVSVMFVNFREMVVTFDYYGVFGRYTKNWKVQK